MRWKSVSQLVVGSTVVYIAMAACAASPTEIVADGKRDAGPSGGSGGVTDPVTDAIAQDAPTGGSRLKARAFVGEDGSRLPTTTLYDSQRDGLLRRQRRAGHRIRGGHAADGAVVQRFAYG